MLLGSLTRRPHRLLIARIEGAPPVISQSDCSCVRPQRAHLFFPLPPNTMGWDGSSLHCARRSRPYLRSSPAHPRGAETPRFPAERAIREHFYPYHHQGLGPGGVSIARIEGAPPISSTLLSPRGRPSSLLTARIQQGPSEAARWASTGDH